MSTLAKIIYEETGLTQGGTPDEYEEVASACRRFAFRCDPRQPLTDERIDALRLATGYAADLQRFTNIVRTIERAHGIGGEA